MSDRIVLSRMVFVGRHGVIAGERLEDQPFEVDVELYLDLGPAGMTDDLAKTIDYREVFELCRATIEGPSHLLLEALAESIASGLLTRFAAGGVGEVKVRVRKPEVALPGLIESAEVEITRRA
jgi:dihydroneopterin aldolase